jgi:hypothetical protein
VALSDDYNVLRKALKAYFLGTFDFFDYPENGL